MTSLPSRYHIPCLGIPQPKTSFGGLVAFVVTAECPPDDFQTPSPLPHTWHLPNKSERKRFIVPSEDSLTEYAFKFCRHSFVISQTCKTNSLVFSGVSNSETVQVYLFIIVFTGTSCFTIACESNNMVIAGCNLRDVSPR